MIKSIDGAVFSRMMLSAAAEIDLNKQKVNELNVFPVPDGDTGTNMSMTLNAASTELRRAENVTLTKAADMTASALLRGARGNSGVILSLLFRGFSKALKGKLEADGRDFAAALTAGVEAAYKAVMKPAEGTILTVSRLTADAALDLAEENCEIEYVLQHCLDTAHAALDNTVNQNPVLKKAGVVDAGGMGFCLILRGMLESLRGNDVVCEDTGAANEEADFGIFDSEDITFAFDTVFIVRKREDITSLDPLREYLGSIGDSLVIGEDADDVKGLLIARDYLLNEERAEKQRDDMRDAVCWIFSQMGERRTREFVDLVSEFTTYMSICHPGQPRPTAEQVREAFVERGKRVAEHMAAKRAEN